MAALAVSDALRNACDLETDIKLPNDLLSGERKICAPAEAIDTTGSCGGCGYRHHSGERSIPGYHWRTLPSRLKSYEPAS